MTLEQFAEIFALLAVQLRFADADEATIRGYFEALKDLEPELVAMAAKKFGASAEWFPKASEWRESVHLIEHQRTEELRAHLRRLPAYLCTGCQDTGWAHDEATNSVSPCGCRRLRRLEVLGRRPWPALPESTEASQ